MVHDFQTCVGVEVNELVATVLLPSHHSTKDLSVSLLCFLA